MADGKTLKSKNEGRKVVPTAPRIVSESPPGTEERLRRLVDNIPEPVAYLDTQRRYVFVNQAFLDLRGLTREQVYGRSPVDVMGPGVNLHFQPLWDQALRGETQTYERQVTNVRGETRWIRGRMVPDYDRAGRICGVYVVATDINEIKEVAALRERRERELRLLMDSMNSPAASVGADMRYRMVNLAFEEWCGKNISELRGKRVPEVVGDERWQEIEPYIRRVLAGEALTMERLLVYPDGHQRWMSVTYTPRFDEAGNSDGYFAVASDIHEQKLVEQQLRRANWMLLSHMENTPLAVMEWDRDGRLIRWSSQAEHLLGWSQEQALGATLRDWRLVYEQDAPQLQTALELLRSGAEHRATVLTRNYHRDGQLIWCEWYNSCLRDEKGKLISILTLAQDVSARIEAEARLQHLATHDALTGLPNRLLLTERLHQAIANARRSGERVAVLFIDLDGFKNVNDTLGHRMGDALLREVGQRLHLALRESDFLARLGGDEFMIVLELISEGEDAGTVAEKLLELMREPVRIDGHELQISASIGIALFPDDCDSPEALLKNADVAMYRAKELGKNTYQFFSSDLAEQRLGDVALEAALKKAVERGELTLAFHPVREAETGRMSGVLVEPVWMHPQLGLVPPERFLALAEHTGYIVLLGEWLLSQALGRCRLWGERGLWVPRLLVNVSARQLRQAHFPDQVALWLGGGEGPPGQLCLALSEDSAGHAIYALKPLIEALHARGLQFALDGFGAGRCSLDDFRHLPLDAVFIDAGFAAEAPVDPRDANILEGLITLGRAFAPEVIAKGVATPEQCAFLAARGCGQVVGRYAGRGMNETEFAEVLRREQGGAGAREVKR
ncbi:MAG: PAS domain S-box protein [Betaproteobacteria bacterium]|nr:PAS domain S-box protein [Betaproteobacteria bacterium]